MIVTSAMFRNDVFYNGSHSFACHQTRALPAYTAQPQRIAGTQCAYPRRDGQAELTWVVPWRDDQVESTWVAPWRHGQAESTWVVSWRVGQAESTWVFP